MPHNTKTNYNKNNGTVQNNKDSNSYYDAPKAFMAEISDGMSYTMTKKELGALNSYRAQFDRNEIPDWISIPLSTTSKKYQDLMENLLVDKGYVKEGIDKYEGVDCVKYVISPAGRDALQSI